MSVAAEFSRKVASAIAMAMAETGTSFEDMDKTLELSANTSRRSFNRLLDGKSLNLETIADMADIMQRDISFLLQKRPTP